MARGARRAGGGAPAPRPRRSASAKSFTLPEADVTRARRERRRLNVREEITFDFFGPFSGGYRDIPLRDGERIDRVSVAEGGDRYVPGGSTTLGTPGAARAVRRGRGRRQDADRLALPGGQPAAHVHRSATGCPGSPSPTTTWSTSTSRSGATSGRPASAACRRRWPRPSRSPPRNARIYGHPVNVKGDTAFGDGLAHLRALDVPAKQFVEMRLLFPRSMLTSTRRAKVVPGERPRRIVAAELADAAEYERSRRKIDDALDHILPQPALHAAARAAARPRRSSAPSGSCARASAASPATTASTSRSRRRTIRRRSSGRCCGSPPSPGRRVHRDAVRPHPPRRHSRPSRSRRRSGAGARWASARSPTSGCRATTPPARGIRSRRASRRSSSARSPTAPLELSELSDKIKEKRESNAKSYSSWQDKVAKEFGKRHWYDNRALAPIILAAIAMTLLGAALISSAPRAWTRAS